MKIAKPGKTWETLIASELMARKLEIFAPDVVLNGFFRLGIESPSAAGALPSLDNFLADLRMISLRASRREDKFPAPFRLRFNRFEFQNQSEQRGDKDFFVPALQSWEFVYQIS